MTKTKKTYQTSDLQKESHHGSHTRKDGQVCARCKRVLRGTSGEKDIYGNRFCSLKCLGAFHGRPTVRG
jgi:hypothetical protein